MPTTFPPALPFISTIFRWLSWVSHSFKGYICTVSLIPDDKKAIYFRLALHLDCLPHYGKLFPRETPFHLWFFRFPHSLLQIICLFLRGLFHWHHIQIFPISSNIRDTLAYKFTDPIIIVFFHRMSKKIEFNTALENLINMQLGPISISSSNFLPLPTGYRIVTAADVLSADSLGPVNFKNWHPRN